MAELKVDRLSAPVARPANRHLGAHWTAPGCGAIALLASAALSASLFWHPRPILLWNASPSSPVGLYAIMSSANLRKGDLVVAWAPAPARRLAGARFYLPTNVPLVKPVRAIAGDRFCAVKSRIFINGRLLAVRRERDLSGRPMPWWSGCTRLKQGELLLISADRVDAFDGRYFGVTSRSELVGRARLLWAKPDKIANHPVADVDANQEGLREHPMSSRPWCWGAVGDPDISDIEP